MNFYFAVDCDEASMSYDRATMYFVVSDSPDPDKTYRDESSVMRNHVGMNSSETLMKCDGFAMYFVGNSSLCLLLYGFRFPGTVAFVI